VPAGRPTSLTEELQTRVCDALRCGLEVEDACKLEGIGLSTYFEWRKRGAAGEEPYASFFQATEEAYLRVDLVLSGSILKAAEKNWKAAAWYKKFRATGGRQQVELSGPGGAPLQGALTQESADLIREKILFGDTKKKLPEGEP